MSDGRPQSVFHSFCVFDSVSRARELMAAHRDLRSLPGVPRAPGDDGPIICATWQHPRMSNHPAHPI